MSTNQYMDFTKATNRTQLTRVLSERVQPISIKFEKDDGSIRTIAATLNRSMLPHNLQHTEINKPRSVFLKVYDVADRGIKTVRWEKILDITNTPVSFAALKPAARPVATPVAVSKPDYSHTAAVNRTSRDQLIRDLESVGFKMGRPVDDAMLQRFAEVREDRVRKELTVEANVLKNILSKVKTIVSQLA